MKHRSSLLDCAVFYLFSQVERCFEMISKEKPCGEGSERLLKEGEGLRRGRRQEPQADWEAVERDQ